MGFLFFELKATPFVFRFKEPGSLVFFGEKTEAFFPKYTGVEVLAPGLPVGLEKTPQHAKNPPCSLCFSGRGSSTKTADLYFECHGEKGKFSSEEVKIFLCSDFNQLFKNPRVFCPFFPKNGSDFAWGKGRNKPPPCRRTPMMKKSMTKTNTPNHKQTNPHKKANPNSFTPINLTEDIVFQYFFTRYQGALISLLQALLPLPQDHKITSLKILNPKLHPLNNPGEKHSICETSNSPSTSMK